MRCEICGRDVDDRSQHHPECISYLPIEQHDYSLESENTRLKELNREMVEVLKDIQTTCVIFSDGLITILPAQAANLSEAVNKVLAKATGRGE